MNLDQSASPSKSKYGLTALIGGIFALLFGGGSLFAIIYIPVTIFAAYKSFKTEKNEVKQINMAKIGIILTIAAVILAFVFQWEGIIFGWLVNSVLK
jgi:uncharacterized membrane protein YjjP (DUF1212 family)